jgi:hypothetical protein
MADCLPIDYHLIFCGIAQFWRFIQPLKMDLTEGSETSAKLNQTPGKYPKENIQVAGKLAEYVCRLGRHFACTTLKMEAKSHSSTWVTNCQQTCASVEQTPTALSISINSPHFKEPEGSLLGSYRPALVPV